MKHLDRIKFIESLKNTVYGYTKNPIASDYGITKVENFISELLEKEKYALPSGYTKALFVLDNIKLAKVLHESITDKEKVFGRELKTSIISGVTRNLKTENEIKVYVNTIGTKYTEFYRTLLEFIRDNPKQVDNLIILLNKINKQSNHAYRCDTFVSCENFCKMSYAEPLLGLNNDDFITFAIRSRKFNLDYKTITKEEIDICFSDYYKFIPDLNPINTEVVEILSPYLSEDDKSLLPDCYALFENLDVTKDLVNILVENNHTKLLNIIIKACTKSFLIDSKDIKLVSNKIKFGEKFKGVADFAYLISGLNDKKITQSKYSTIIKIKKMVTKNFYRFLINNKELLLKTVDNISLDVFSKLNKVLELGQLNVEEYTNLVDTMAVEEKRYIGTTQIRVWDYDFGYKLSYLEFSCLMNTYDKDTFDIIAELKDLKSSQRYLRIKEIDDVNTSLNSPLYVFYKEDAMKVLGNNSIKAEMRNNNPLSIDNMSEYFNYRVLSSKYEVKTIEDYRKLLLAHKFVGLDSIKDRDIDEVIMNCHGITSIMDMLNLSEEFKKQYSNEILRFFVSEDFEYVYGYSNNRRVKESQINSLALITKAIIAGKYNELKFVKDDIKKEAGAEISDEGFECWKETSKLESGEYKVCDESSFKRIMSMGEVPVRSCMNYRDGMYSYCLLSNFDTTKKILTIHKGGRYVGRAILRLTKMSDVDNVVIEDGLSFIDVDKFNEVSVDKDISEGQTHCNEKLILFLEKQYTTLDTKDSLKVYNLMISLLKEKAEKIGATLVVSRSYKNLAESSKHEFTCENKYVYITASKNGYQYLDSFDGSTSKALCYKNGEVLIY